MSSTLQSLSPERQPLLDIPQQQAQRADQAETFTSEGRQLKGHPGIVRRFEGEVI
jgi:hypothetical protein